MHAKYSLRNLETIPFIYLVMIAAFPESQTATLCAKATDLDDRVSNLVKMHNLDPNPTALADISSQAAAISFAKVSQSL